MNAVTQFEDSSLAAVLTQYAIGDLVRNWPAANGIENSNYFIETLDGKQPRNFVLTIMEQDAYAGESYIDMMYALHDRGLPVAPPLSGLNGRFIENISGKPAMLQNRLPGKHIYNPTRKQVSALARFIARMHITMEQAKVSLPPYPRDLSWLREQASLTRGYLSFADAELIQSSLTQVDSLLARSDVQSLPRGMIHGDLFRDNVLFNGGALSGVLDFHHAACGFWIYDLVVMANDWCNDAGGRLDPERTFDMLHAYHKIRPLQETELWFFSAFALYAALVFWLSRLTTALSNTEAGPVRFKNPDEFKRIVQYHTRHSFFLDPRRLSI